MFFTELTISAQQNQFLEWMKYGESTKSIYNDRISKPVYIVPYSTIYRRGRRELSNAIEKEKVCVNAMLLLLGKKFRFYSTVRNHFTNHTIPTNNYNANENRRRKILIRGEYEELMEFLNRIETLAEPSATRLVREVTGTLTIRDNNEDTVYLPSSMSKRGVYRQYCDERGKKVVTKHDGSTFLETLPNHPNEKECITWAMFHLFWKEHFYYMKVSKCSEDICRECYIFFNRNKYYCTVIDNGEDSSSGSYDGDDREQQYWRELYGRDIDGEEEKEEMSNQYENDKEVDNSEGEAVEDSEEDVSDTESVGTLCGMLSEINVRGAFNEQEILKASRHVENAIGMRKYLNKYIEIARTHVREKIVWSERTNVLIGDYAQYMYLPHFGEKQPGESYYYVPLNVSNFGMANVAACNSRGDVCDHLYSHVYKEGTARRGGNEVASLVMKTLHHLSWMDLPKNGNGKKYVLCFDNCPGQNKNGMVIRLAMYLVEMNFFESVIICFLVKGHTKNTCDRLFNKLKEKYRKRNVFTFDQMIALMNNEYCTVLKSSVTDFKDYDEFLGDFYCCLKVVLKHHIFECRRNENNEIVFESQEGDVNSPEKNCIKKYLNKGFTEEMNILKHPMDIEML